MIYLILCLNKKPIEQNLNTITLIEQDGVIREENLVMKTSKSKQKEFSKEEVL
jgi:uncharacterized protein YrzB (UPF0473 family)